MTLVFVLVFDKLNSWDVIVQVSLSFSPSSFTCLVKSSMGQESLSHSVSPLKNGDTIINKSKSCHRFNTTTDKRQSFKHCRNDSSLCSNTKCMLQQTISSRIPVMCLIFPCWRRVVATFAVTTLTYITKPIQTSPPREETVKRPSFTIHSYGENTQMINLNIIKRKVP